MRAAIYARYSSELQRDASIEDQVRLCRERIDQEGWTLTATYTDHAMSGASRLRPGYQKLIEDARSRKFEAVVAEALDRLSRDQEDIARLYKQLSFAGVKLLTLAEGEISELHVGLKGTMNALFLKDLASKIRRGQRGRIATGFSPGGLSYGYRVVRELDDDGNLLRGQRCVDVGEAAIVRRIFEDYVKGASPRAIAIALNAEGIPSPRGAGWSPSTINGPRQRGSGILWNEAYRGCLVYNRVRMIRDPDTGMRISRPNPREEWIVVDAPNLRIVPEELWGAAQAIKKSGENYPSHVQRRPKRLLSGLLRCGQCGGPYVMRDGSKMSCREHRDKGICDNNRSIHYAKIEARVLDGLRHKLLSPDMLAIFVGEYRAAAKKLRRQAARRSGAAACELRDTESRINRIVDCIAEGTDTPVMRERLIVLEDRRKVLKDEIATAKNPVTIDLHPNLPRVYRRIVDDLKASIEDNAIRTEAHGLIRQLIDRIVVRPGAPGTEPDVELYGMLAPVLANASENGGPQPDDRLITMVAEEGLEPPTQGL